MLTPGVYAWGGKETLALRIGMMTWRQKMLLKTARNCMRFQIILYVLSRKAEVVGAEEKVGPHEENQLLIA